MTRLAFARLVAAGLVALHLYLGFAFIRAAGPTYDEPLHLAAGVGYWHAQWLDPMAHPPLARMWAAIPILFMRPSFEATAPYLPIKPAFRYGDRFFYQNSVPPETMLAAARAWSFLTWTAVLIAVVLAWARRLGGDAGMVAAAALYALCPALISNVAIATTEGATTALFLLTLWVLSRPGALSLTRWAAAGACAGFANGAKFSMITLFAIVFVAAYWDRRTEPDRHPEPAWKEGAAFLACATLAVVVVFQCTQVALYEEGLRAMVGQMAFGKPSFFFGRRLLHGSILYFPLALAVKTPLPILVLAALGVAVLPKSERRWVVLPALVFFAAAMSSKMNIGYRHVLPVVPFMVLWGASGSAWLWRHREDASRRLAFRAACLGMFPALAVSTLRVHPYYLAYFNEAVGGATHGSECLTDSNLDWGQDLPSLAKALSEIGNPPIFLSFFGTADPSRYGIRYVPVAMHPQIGELERRPAAVDPAASGRVLLAVSATNLRGTYFSDPTYFGWLQDRRPLKIVGYSIFLYDITGDRQAYRSLAALTLASGQDAPARALMRLADGGG